MRRLLMLCIIIFIAHSLHAQPSDILTLKKKNGQNIKSFYSGSRIVFQTIYGNFVDGPIESIKNDTVSIRIYVTYRYLSTLGVPHTDTIHTEVQKFHYKEIAHIKISGREKFLQSKLPEILMIGGAGYITLNVANSFISHYSITEKKNLDRLAIAGGLGAIGFLIHKLFPVKSFSTDKDKIEYIKITTDKPAQL